MPTIDDALRRGEISYSKVRAMVRIATPENEVLLLDYARFMTGAQLEAACRKYALVQRHGMHPHPLADLQRRYVRRRDTEEGMIKIEAVLHPEEAEAVWTMLNHAATQLVRGPESSPGDNSAEAHEPIPAGMMDSAPVGDSAETSEPAQGHSGSENSAEAHEPMRACMVKSAPTGDSAETSEPMQGHCRSDKSAEAHEPMRACMVESAPTGDSAETPEPMQGHSQRATPSIGTAICTVGDTAEASEPTPANAIVGSSAEQGEAQLGELRDDRSLLELLLDEAEMLRDAEVVPGSDRGSAPTELPTEGWPSVLQARADATRRAFNRADALVSIAQGYLRGDSPNRAPIELTLTIPASSLRAGATDPVEVGELGETFVSCETARRLSCDSGVVEVIEDDQGTPLSVGRKRRTIHGSLKRALHKRDKTCTYPGCTNRLFLEGHHVQHWADGGETSLMNACLLCTAHHHYVHEYGYTIELGPGQRPRFRDPHGRLVAAVPERPVTADLGWPRIRTENEPLAISADTIACKWDGRPVDYGAIVGHLVVADGLG